MSAVISVGLNAYLATAGSRFVPYVAFVNEQTGETIGAAYAERAVSGDALRQSVIERWIVNLRSVTTDAVAQRQLIDRVFMHVTNTGSAQAFVQDWYSAHNPLEAGRSGTVSVQVESVVRVSPGSDKSYQIDWIETRRDRNGRVESEDRWRAIATVAISAPKEEKTARQNPLGLYVTDLSWSKVLQ
jgi:type IV secretion system protein VirB5